MDKLKKEGDDIFDSKKKQQEERLKWIQIFGNTNLEMKVDVVTTGWLTVLRTDGEM